MAPAPRVTHGAERSKLAVVRLLDATLAEGGIDQQGHDMLYRMIMMTSAIGEQLQLIAQTSGVARASTAETIQRYATSLLQGCEVFGGYFEGRMDCARQVAERLPGNKRGKGEESVVSMEAWKTALRTIHLPSGHEEQLFASLSEHYDNCVCRQLTRLRLRAADGRVMELQEQLEDLGNRLDEIRKICDTADQIALALELEFVVVSRRLHDRRPKQQVHEGTRSAAMAGTRKASCEEAETSDVEERRHRSSYKPRVPSEPPQLPLLPFQAKIDASSDAVRTTHLRSNSSSKKSFSAIERERPYRHLIDKPAARGAPREPAPVKQESSHSNFNKSFSVVEDEVTHRGHFRNLTDASSIYTAQPAEVVTPGTIQRMQQRTNANRVVGGRRKDSASVVPRIFTGSFSELESKVLYHRLHKIRTPEHQPSSPAFASTASPTESCAASSEEGTVVRDFADAAATPRMCPSPVTLLQRREALSEHDPQWGSRLVKGEVIRSRRPVQRSQTINDHTGGLEAWLRQPSAARPSSPGASGSAIRVRPRENTL